MKIKQGRGVPQAGKPCVETVYFTGMNNNDIVLFETKDSSAALPVRMTGDEEVYFDAEDKVLPHEYFSDI